MADAGHDELMGLLRQGARVFNGWRVEHADVSIDLAGADLSGLQLDEVFLCGATLVDANLSHASLRNAVFSGAYLKNARFVAADLRGAVFGPPDLVDSKITFSPVGRRIMWGAELEGAVFTGANIEGTSFRETDLDGVDLRGCALTSLDLRHTSLDKALVDELPESAGALQTPAQCMVVPVQDELGNTWISTQWTGN
jgi:uncharacterized protein YjbI with pentapeptide repeats